METTEPLASPAVIDNLESAIETLSTAAGTDRVAINAADRTIFFNADYTPHEYLSQLRYIAGELNWMAARGDDRCNDLPRIIRRLRRLTSELAGKPYIEEAA